MSDASVSELLVLAFVGLIAGAVNTVAGAGSLLLLPVLIWTGLPADAANATNRIGILAQTTMAVIGFHRAGQRIVPTEQKMIALVMVGGLLGSFIATLLSPDSMELAIVVAMAGMLVLSLVPQRKKDEAAPAPIALRPLLIAGLLGVGVYGGFLQAGVGILLLLFLGQVTRMDLVRANVLKSYATLGLTLAAMGVFYSSGERIDLPRGLALASGSAFGGLFGARATVRLGATFVRRAVIVAIAAALSKMIYDRF